MTPDAPTILARLALKSAGIELGEAEETASYQVEVTNTVSVRHSIAELKLGKAPEAARSYWFFRPGLVNKALAETRKQQKVSPEEFVRRYAPDYGRGSITRSTYDHDFDPLAYRKRSEKVLDRVEARACSRCSGQGKWDESRSEEQRTTCLACGGTGGEYVTEYIFAPGRTDHGAPRQKYNYCGSCSGKGYNQGATRYWVETITCTRCNGKGALEKKYYRREKVFYADAVRSQFRREVQFVWPQEIQRLIDHSLVNDEDLFKFCEKSGETSKVQGLEVLIGVKVNLAVRRRKPEVEGAPVAVSELEVRDRSVLFSDTPLLDPYLKRLTGELAGMPWAKVLDRAERDPFVREITDHALKNANPAALVPKLGFMASGRTLGALLGQLRSSERRRRVIGWTVAVAIGAVAACALILFGTRP